MLISQKTLGYRTITSDAPNHYLPLNSKTARVKAGHENHQYKHSVPQTAKDKLQYNVMLYNATDNKCGIKCH